MQLVIRNTTTNRASAYDAAALRREAFYMAKQAGQRFITWHVELLDTGTARVVAVLDAGHGTTATHTCAI